MSTRYRITHNTTINNVNIEYRVDLNDSQYSGSIENRVALDTFFQWEYEKLNERDPFENPVQKSSLKINLGIRDLSEITFLQEIINSDEDRFQLEFYINSDHKWTGKVLNDLMEYPETKPPPFSASITAKDLSHIEGVDYDLAEQTTLTRLSVIIAECLKETGLNLPIRSFTNITNEDISDQTQDFLYAIYHQKYALRNQGEALKCFEVLSHICRRYNLIIRQSDARWLVEQLPAVAKGDDVQFDYDADGLNPVSSTPDRTVTVDQVDGFILPNSINKITGPLKSISSVYQHRVQILNLDTYQGDGSFDEPEPEDYWVVHNNPLETTEHSVNIEDDGTHYFGLSMDVEATTVSGDGALGDAFIRILAIPAEGGSVSWYDPDAGSFSSTQEQVAIPLSGSGGVATGSLDLESVQLPFGTDILRVQFLWADLTHLGSPEDTDTVTFSNINGTVFNESFRNWDAAIKHKYTQTGAYSVTEDVGTVYLGDGPTSGENFASKGRPAIGANITDQITPGNFKLRGEASGETVQLENLALREMMCMRRNGIRNLRAMLWMNYSPENLIDYDGNNWFFLGGRFQAKESRWNSNILELDYERDAGDTFSSVIESGGDPGATGTTTSPGVGDGGGGVSDHGALDNLDIPSHHPWAAQTDLSNLSSVTVAQDNLGLTDGSADLDLNSLATGDITVNGQNLFPNGGEQALGTGDDVEFNAVSIGIIHPYNAGFQVFSNKSSIPNPWDDADIVLGNTGSSGDTFMYQVVDQDNHGIIGMREWGIGFPPLVLQNSGGPVLIGTINQAGSETLRVNGETLLEDTLTGVDADFSRITLDHSIPLIMNIGSDQYRFEQSTLGDNGGIQFWNEVGDSTEKDFVIGGQGSQSLHLNVFDGDATIERGSLFVGTTIDRGIAINASSLNGHALNVNGTANIQDTLTGTDAVFSDNVHAGSFSTDGLITSEAQSANERVRLVADSESNNPSIFWYENDGTTLRSFIQSRQEILRIVARRGSQDIHLQDGDVDITDGGLTVDGVATFEDDVILSQEGDETDNPVRADRMLQFRTGDAAEFTEEGAVDLTDDRLWDLMLFDHGDGQRGVLNAGAQDIYGIKTFTDNTIFEDQISTPTFFPGFTGTGWSVRQIAGGEWEATFDAAVIRGPLTVYELVINRVTYQDGSEIMGPGGGKVESVVDSTSGSEVLAIEDPNETDATSFASDDIVMVQEVDVNRTDVVKRIVRRVASITNNEVTLTTLGDGPSDTGSFADGDDLVAIGNTTNTDRQSIIYTSVIDSGAPFERVLTGIDSWTAWVNAIPVVETGNLNGRVFDGNQLSGYGMFTQRFYATDEFNVLIDTGEIMRFGKDVDGVDTHGIYFDENNYWHTGGFSVQIGGENLEDSLNDLFADVGDNESAIAGLDTRVSDNEGDLTSLTSQVTGIESDVGDIGARNVVFVNSNDNLALIELLSGMEGAEVNISGTQVDLQANSNFSDLSDDVDGAESDIAGLTLDVGDIESDITGINNDLGDVEDDIGTIGARTVLFTNSNGKVASIDLLSGAEGSAINIEADQLDITATTTFSSGYSVQDTLDDAEEYARNFTSADNIITNGDFELGRDGWNAGSVVSVSDGKYGSNVLEATAGENVRGSHIPIEEGETIYGEVWVRVTSDASGSNRFYAGVSRYKYDKSSDTDHGNPNSYFIAQNESPTAADGWIKYTATWTNPHSTVKYIRPILLLNYQQSDGTTQVGYFRFSKTETRANEARDSARNNLAEQLGYLDYDDLVNFAADQQTFISGGYINTALLQTGTIASQNGNLIFNLDTGQLEAGTFLLDAGSGALVMDSTEPLIDVGGTTNRAGLVGADSGSGGADSITFWSGGLFADRETAPIYFRRSGAGRLADGNIFWDENGNAVFEGSVTVTGGNASTQDYADTQASNALADAESYADGKVYRYSANSIDGNDGYDTYSPKADIARMNIGTSSPAPNWPGNSTGEVWTYRRGNNDAKQVFRSINNSVFERFWYASGGGWTSWRQTEDTDGAQSKADSARDIARDNIAERLGYSDYSDLSSDTLPNTLITGNTIRTTLVDAHGVLANVGTFTDSLHIGSNQEHVLDGANNEVSLAGGLLTATGGATPTLSISGAEASIDVDDIYVGAGGFNDGSLTIASSNTQGRFNGGSYASNPAGVPQIGLTQSPNDSTFSRVYLTMGETYEEGAWTGRFGFGFTPAKGDPMIFEMSRDMTSNDITAMIGGANFDNSGMWSQNNAGVGNGGFEDTGLYINWAQDLFSLGSAISFDSGAAFLGDLTVEGNISFDPGGSLTLPPSAGAGTGTLDNTGLLLAVQQNLRWSGTGSLAGLALGSESNATTPQGGLNVWSSNNLGLHSDGDVVIDAGFTSKIEFTSRTRRDHGIVDFGGTSGEVAISISSEMIRLTDHGGIEISEITMSPSEGTGDVLFLINRSGTVFHLLSQGSASRPGANIAIPSAYGPRQTVEPDGMVILGYSGGLWFAGSDHGS